MSGDGVPSLLLRVLGGDGENEHHRGRHRATCSRRRRITMRSRPAQQSARPNHSRSSASVAVFGSVAPLRGVATAANLGAAGDAYAGTDANAMPGAPR